MSDTPLPVMTGTHEQIMRHSVEIGDAGWRTDEQKVLVREIILVIAALASGEVKVYDPKKYELWPKQSYGSGQSLTQTPEGTTT